MATMLMRGPSQNENQRRAPSPSDDNSVRSTRPRGFVMIVIVAVMLILFAALTATLSSVRQNRVITLRQQENSRAQNIADACLAKGVAVATAHFQARGGEEFDYDQLLDPDANPTSGDEYVFNEPGSTTQQVPSTATDPLHRYALVRMDGGACFVRFDDNLDDVLPGYTAQTSNTPRPGGTPVIEGAGININTRDRDASIFVTAIGVYPAPATTPDNEIYARGHARMSLRQFFTATSAPAVYANGDVQIGNSVEMCGTGGVRGRNVTVDPSSCVCGDALAFNMTDGITSCSPEATRCPDGSTSAPNAFDAFPTHSTRVADFPTRCAPFSLTEGEAPPPVVNEDPVSGNSHQSRLATVFAAGGSVPVFTGYGGLNGPFFQQPKLALYFRERGGAAAHDAVFVWDGRAMASVVPASLAGTRCDLRPDPPTAISNSEKHSVCNAVVPGAQCIITGSFRDEEFCDLPVGSPTVRCDRLQNPPPPNDPTPWPPPRAPQAVRDAVCSAIVPGATCGTATDPAYDEFCQAPEQYVNCTQAPSVEFPRPASGWTTFGQNVAALEASTAASNRLPLCWRMVAQLDGIVEPGEWEQNVLGTARFSIPPGAVVPHLRNDPLLEIRTSAGVVVPPRVEDVAQMRTTAEARSGLTRFTPIPLTPIVLDSGEWHLDADWHNHEAAKRALPTPSLLYFDGNVRVESGVQLDGITLLTNGGVRIEGGDDTILVAADTRAAASSADPFSFAGGVARCTLDVNEHVFAAFSPATGGARSSSVASLTSVLAPESVSRRFAIRAAGSILITGSATVFGRVSAGGAINVHTDETCLVGGISAAAADSPASVCTTGIAGVCGAPAICLAEPTAIIGDVFSRSDISAPNGLWLSRGSTGNSSGLNGLKIARAAAGGSVCIGGPARIVGQVSSQANNGRIVIGNDVLFLQSGEVGFGFGTRRSVFSETAW